MLNSTPEYVAAHLNELADTPQKAGPEAIARYRLERRNRRTAKIGRLVASVSHVLPFVRRKSGGEVAPSEPKPAI